MEVADIRQLLHDAAALRAPIFVRDGDTPTSPTRRIELLEEYMQDLAVARGSLEEAMLVIDQARFSLDDRWEKIDGWRQTLGDGAAKATGPQIVRAKAEIDRETYEGLREAKWLISRIAAQIRRLEKDEESTSRRYSLLTG